MQLIFEMQVQKDLSDYAIQSFADDTVGEEGERAYFDRACSAYMQHRHDIDAMIEGALNGWKLRRLGRVDLAILRLAVAEMKFLEEDDVPDAVAINEAVNMAKKYGDEDSAKFINGVLGTISRA